MKCIAYFILLFFSFVTENPPQLNVAIDCSKVPEAMEWAENAATVAKKQFPLLVEALDDEGFKPRDSIMIIIEPMDGVAHATRGRIVISADWIKKHPEDIGMVVHELVHIVQAYQGRVPGWITEGIADYLRFFEYEKNGNQTCRVNPEKAKYTDSYRTTAAFFDWIVRTQDAGFIKKLNSVCRKGLYSNDFFKNLTGMTVDELWDDFIESLKNQKS